MSSRTIGNYSVRIARTFYEGMGYVTDVVEKTGRFRKFKDFLSEYAQIKYETEAGFDIICIHSKIEFKTVLCQVCTNKPKSHAVFQRFANDFPGLIISQYVRATRGKGKDKVFEYVANGEKIVREV